ncbi:hypothetical protein IPF86_01745 [Candidatus Nomurabacteria bacterium]|jgi:ring-1,2-phenylacetyl-CoA epoxidase subunit PaaB|nr:MAG: hypothetical protein IPF86_01745 [Candidatus Nomurabacteria bacterium]
MSKIKEPIVDPRILRMDLPSDSETVKVNYGEHGGNYEVFVRKSEKKPFVHVGSLHASDAMMALLLAKEVYGRRQVISESNICIVETVNMYGWKYDVVESRLPAVETQHPCEPYQVFAQKKRGEQHEAVGTIEASSPEEALVTANASFGLPKFIHVWVAKVFATHTFTTEVREGLFVDSKDENSNKHYREAGSYALNVQRKLNTLKEENKTKPKTDP